MNTLRTTLRDGKLPTLAPEPVRPDLRPKFPPDELGFQTELRRRVDAYFKQNGLSERDCRPMYL